MMCQKKMSSLKRLRSLLPLNSTVFISDIHLSEHDSALQELFLSFLQGPALNAKRLYILGDLFDVWVGKDINVEFHDKIIHSLKKLSDKGISLYFMAGNRDFLLENNFMKKAQIQKLSDPTVIELYGKSTVLTHGDKLCTDDILYQRYRSFAQHPLTRMIFLLLPKKVRTNIARKLRMNSQNYQKNQALTILDVTQEAVEKMMTKFSVDHLIHGHVHRPKFHNMNVSGKTLKRFVLGDWHKTSASLIFSTPTDISLATYNPIDGIQIKESQTLADLPA